MVWIVPFIVIGALLAFDYWMFLDMLKNPALPPCFITTSNRANARQDWTIAFVLLNILTAGYYYFTVYRR